MGSCAGFPKRKPIKTDLSTIIVDSFKGNGILKSTHSQMVTNISEAKIYEMKMNV